MQNSQGPATFGQGATFPVEQDLGMKDPQMNITTIKSGGVAVFSGGRFGSNLLIMDPASMLNPQGRASPGLPTWLEGVRFGDSKMTSWPDPAPMLNPGG